MERRVAEGVVQKELTTGQRFVNLTTRMVVIMDLDGHIKLRVPASGQVATCKVIPITQEMVGDIEIGSYEYKDPCGIPDPQEKTFYIVPYAVLRAVEGKRQDVVAPDTSPGSVVRNSRGIVDGVRRFCRTY